MRLEFGVNPLDHDCGVAGLHAGRAEHDDAVADARDWRGPRARRPAGASNAWHGRIAICHARFVRAVALA